MSSTGDSHNDRDQDIDSSIADYVTGNRDFQKRTSEQMPTEFFVKEIESKPIWSIPEVSTLLDANFELIRDEYFEHRNNSKFVDSIRRFVDGPLDNNWTVIYLMEEGIWSIESSILFKKTRDILSNLPIFQCR